jgi:hypothetical protein
LTSNTNLKASTWCSCFLSPREIRSNAQKTQWETSMTRIYNRRKSSGPILMMGKVSASASQRTTKTWESWSIPTRKKSMNSTKCNKNLTLLVSKNLLKPSPKL